MSPLADARGRSFLILAAIVVGAAALRAIGLAYGLPHVYNPDEVAIMHRALAFGTGDPNPRNFVYPTLYFYVLFGWEGLAFLAGWMTGVFPSIAAFERSLFVDPTFIFAAGRLLTLVCGCITVWATFQLGRRLFDRSAGIIAAALLAVAPLAVRDAHYVKHDVPVTLVIVLAHLALVSGIDRPWRWILAGGVAGLAMSTHYYAVFLVVPIVLLALLRESPQQGPPARARIMRLVQAGSACALAFAVTSPFLLADLALAWRDITANSEIVVSRATDRSGVFGSAWFYLTWLFESGSGRITFLLALAGIPIAFRSGWRTATLMLAFPVAFLVFIANTFPASRYLNPVLPFVALLAGAAISWGLAQRGALRLAGAVVCVIAIVEGTAASLQAGAFFRQTDTRTLALEWFEREVPAGTSVLVQPYSVPVRMSRDALLEALTHHLGDARRASIKFQRQLALDPYPAPAYRAIYLGEGGLDVDRIYVAPDAFDVAGGLSPLRALAVTHVIRKRYNDDGPELASFDRALEREGRLAAAFSPYAAGAGADAARPVTPFLHNTDARIDGRLERPGPVIEIWTIP